MKKKYSNLITGILLMGLGIAGVSLSLHKIWIYFATEEISFQLKPMMPIYEGNEALMMTAVMAIVWIMIIVLGYTDIRKNS